MSASEEWLDVLDEAGNPTGKRKLRAEVHRDGDWHRTFHLWILTFEGLLLFQRRAPTKLVEPGKIDVSVGGHFAAGEGLNEVLREVDEELGFLPAVHELHHLGEHRTERFYDDVTDREFQDTYLLHRDAPLDSYLLNCAESSVLYEVPIQAAIDLHRAGTPVAVAGWDCQARVNNALLHDDDVIQRARDETADTLELILDWWNMVI